MVNASNSFFKVTFSLKVNLRSNVKEASLAESKIYRSIGQLPILGFFICLERLAVEQSKGLVMGCHWHSVLITGHDDGITLVGVRVSE